MIFYPEMYVQTSFFANYLFIKQKYFGLKFLFLKEYSGEQTCLIASIEKI